MRKKAIISCLYLGFFSQVAQILILREALTAFAGVEMVLGLTLCVWLLTVGLGGFAGNKLDRLRRKPLVNLQVLYLIAGLLLPITIIALRSLSAIFGFMPGEIVGFSTTFLGATLCLTPLCFVFGILFAANARVYHDNIPQWVGRVYLWEALGATSGGLLITFIFIPYISQLTVSLGLLFLSLAVVLSLKAKTNPLWIIISGLLTLVVIAAGDSAKLIQQLDRQTRAISHTVGQQLAVTDSPYGQLAITRYGEQYGLYLNGSLTAAYPDPQTAEEAVHFALLSHPRPQSALLIGGGLTGAIAQLRKHKVKIDYVELDPELIRLARENLPPEVTTFLDSCRIIYQDGRRYLSSVTDQYDVILCNLGEPSTALVNRFFTREFFLVVRAHLTAGGIFSFRMPSSESYLNPERAMFLSSLTRTLRSVFTEVLVLPGENNIFLATDRPGVLISKPESFITRLKEREITNQFVNEHLIPFRLTDAAYDFINQHVNHPTARVNTDFHPVCYYYNAVLWNLHFAGPEKWLLRQLERLSPGHLWGGLSCLAFVLLGWVALSLRRRRLSLLYSLFTAGLTMMTMEIVLLYGFQIFLGYVYARMGLLIACFMGGLSLGSYFFTRHRSLSGNQIIALHALSAATVLAFILFAGSVSPATSSSVILEGIFYLLSVLFGFLGGAVFVLANALYLREFAEPDALPVAMGYGVDLIGAATGALVVSAVLLPLWGIHFTLWLVIGINLATGIGLLLARVKSR